MCVWVWDVCISAFVVHIFVYCTRQGLVLSHMWDEGSGKVKKIRMKKTDTALVIILLQWVIVRSKQMENHGICCSSTDAYHVILFVMSSTEMWTVIIVLQNITMIVTGHVHVCEKSRERLHEMMFRNLCLYKYCVCVSVGLCIHVLLILLLRVLSLPFAGCFTGHFVFLFF